MKTRFVAFLVAAVAGLTASCSEFDRNPPPTGTAVGQRLPEFTADLTTVAGGSDATKQIDSLRVRHPVVYAFVGVTCPATQAYVDRFKALETEYGPKGVDFVYVYSNSNDTPEAKRAFHTEKGLTGAMVDDQGHRLSQLFKAQRTSEMFFVDKRGVVLYHGAVDDSRDAAGVKKRLLAAALDEHLAGKPVTTTESPVYA